jgi:hypothetical protein
VPEQIPENRLVQKKLSETLDTIQVIILGTKPAMVEGGKKFTGALIMHHI